MSVHVHLELLYITLIYNQSLGSFPLPGDGQGLLNNVLAYKLVGVLSSTQGLAWIYTIIYAACSECPLASPLVWMSSELINIEMSGRDSELPSLASQHIL